MIIVKCLKLILYGPSWLIFKFFGQNELHKELQNWVKVLRIDYGSEFKNFMYYFNKPEYRSVLYWRLGIKAIFLKRITPPPCRFYIFQPRAIVLGMA